MKHSLIVKKTLIYGGLLVVTAFLVFRLFYNTTGLREHGRVQQMILFVSSTCPHCLNVQQFVEQNEVHKHLDLSVKEITGGTKDNLNELIDVARNHCHLTMPAIPVPLLWTKEVCYMGDVTIINYLKKLLEQP